MQIPKLVTYDPEMQSTDFSYMIVIVRAAYKEMLHTFIVVSAIEFNALSNHITIGHNHITIDYNNTIIEYT